MAYWNGTGWADDPADPPRRQGPIARTTGRRFFDWMVTAIMVLAIPLSASVLTRTTDAAGAPHLATDLRLVSDGLVAAEDAEVTATQWAGYRWRGRAPVQVTLRPILTTAGFVNATYAAAAAWSQSSVADVVVGSSGKRRVDILEGAYGTAVPAAWTQVFKRNGYISSVTIYLNTDKLGGWSDWMLQFALCHEVGHALGLDHQYGALEPSCLSPELAGTAPNATDYAQLELIYRP
jgi:hypothetical protein